MCGRTKSRSFLMIVVSYLMNHVCSCPFVCMYMCGWVGEGVGGNVYNITLEHEMIGVYPF